MRSFVGSGTAHLCRAAPTSVAVLPSIILVASFVAGVLFGEPNITADGIVSDDLKILNISSAKM